MGDEIRNFDRGDKSGFMGDEEKGGGGIYL
jgi:hypothetical protein